MKRNVGILLFEDVEVLDFAGPFEVFSVASQLQDYSLFNVFTLGKEAGLVRAVNGLHVQADYGLEAAPAIDLLVIPGGVGVRKFVEDEAALQQVGTLLEASALAFSVCSGALVLAKLGKLDGREFCTHHQVYDRVQTFVKDGKPQPHKRFVASADNLYSSGGISAGIDLSLHLVEKLAGREAVVETVQYMEYRWDESDAFIPFPSVDAKGA